MQPFGASPKTEAPKTNGKNAFPWFDRDNRSF
jgi:hypothetical protein